MKNTQTSNSFRHPRLLCGHAPQRLDDGDEQDPIVDHSEAIAHNAEREIECAEQRVQEHSESDSCERLQETAQHKSHDEQLAAERHPVARLKEARGWGGGRRATCRRRLLAARTPHAEARSAHEREARGGRRARVPERVDAEQRPAPRAHRVHRAPAAVRPEGEREPVGRALVGRLRRVQVVYEHCEQVVQDADGRHPHDCQERQQQREAAREATGGHIAQQQQTRAAAKHDAEVQHAIEETRGGRWQEARVRLLLVRCHRSWRSFPETSDVIAQSEHFALFFRNEHTWNRDKRVSTRNGLWSKSRI